MPYAEMGYAPLYVSLQWFTFYGLILSVTEKCDLTQFKNSHLKKSDLIACGQLVTFNFFSGHENVINAIDTALRKLQQT